MSHSALYYPFTEPSKPSFIKNSLFLWDSVDFIVPFKGYRPQGRNAEEDEALEIIGRAYVPTIEDKQRAHEELELFISTGNYTDLQFSMSDEGAAYGFYPQKLLNETWQMLQNSELAKILCAGGSISEPRTAKLLGYYMMSILASSCNTMGKKLVTDDADPYKALDFLLVDEAKGNWNTTDWHGRLLAISLGAPDFQGIELRKMIELRKSEDQLVTEMRRNFLETVEQTVELICEHSQNSNYVGDILRSYKSETENNLKDLKKALRLNVVTPLLSKEFLMTLSGVAAVAGSRDNLGEVGHTIGSLAVVGGLTKSLLNYRGKRRELLSNNTSSWLFTTKTPKHGYY